MQLMWRIAMPGFGHCEHVCSTRRRYHLCMPRCRASFTHRGTYAGRAKEQRAKKDMMTTMKMVRGTAYYYRCSTLMVWLHRCYRDANPATRSGVFGLHSGPWRSVFRSIHFDTNNASLPQHLKDVLQEKISKKEGPLRPCPKKTSSEETICESEISNSKVFILQRLA